MSSVKLTKKTDIDLEIGSLESNTIKRKTLKQELNAIDQHIIKDIANGYYETRFRIECGMWLKGEIIAEYLGEFRGVKSPLPSWRQLERDTGRNHKSLKKWHDLYMSNLDEEKYKEIAKQKAEMWTLRALAKVESLNKSEAEALPEPEDEKIKLLRDWTECFLDRYSFKEDFEMRTNHEDCKGCLKLFCCREFNKIVEKFLVFRDKLIRNG